MEILDADADLSIFGPSMVKSFIGENNVSLQYRFLQCL